MWVCMLNALVKCLTNNRPTDHPPTCQMVTVCPYKSQPQSSSSSSSSSSSCDTKKLTLDMHFESNKTETHKFLLQTEFPISAPAAHSTAQHNASCHSFVSSSSSSYIQDQFNMNRAIRHTGTGFCYTAGFNCQNDAIHCPHALSCSRSIHNVRNTHSLPAPLPLATGTTYPLL